LIFVEMDFQAVRLTLELAPFRRLIVDYRAVLCGTLLKSVPDLTGGSSSEQNHTGDGEVSSFIAFKSQTES
jgi:hypothetical protein